MKAQWVVEAFSVRTREQELCIKWVKGALVNLLAKNWVIHLCIIKASWGGTGKPEVQDTPGIHS